MEDDDLTLSDTISLPFGLEGKLRIDTLTTDTKLKSHNRSAVVLVTSGRVVLRLHNTNLPSSGFVDVELGRGKHYCIPAKKAYCLILLGAKPAHTVTAFQF